MDPGVKTARTAGPPPLKWGPSTKYLGSQYTTEFLQGGAPAVMSWFINHSKYRYLP